MKPTTIAIATANTGKFDWICVGRDEAEARALLFAAWRTHAEQFDADVTHLSPDDINVRVAPIGAAFRDDTQVPILPAGHGTHTGDEHTRDAKAIGHASYDRRGKVLCNFCQQPAFYCRVNDSFHHVEPTTSCYHAAPAVA